MASISTFHEPLVPGVNIMTVKIDGMSYLPWIGEKAVVVAVAGMMTGS
jgi:hypothetical protein